MAARVMSKANPAMLRWARETRGYSLEVAAGSLDVEKDLLEKAERGEDRLSFAQLRKAADKYKRPLAVFFLPEPPRSRPRVTDFRRLPESMGHELSPALLLQVRRLSYKRSIAIRLSEFAGAVNWNFVGSRQVSEDPENVGTEVRRLLDLPLEITSRWREPYARMNGWRSAIERTGTLVFIVQRMPIIEMRGMSIAEAPFPLLAVNRADAPGPRLFSLLHEFTHILIGRSSLCDDFVEDEYRNDDEARRIEVFCNAVAAASLMPQNAFRSAAAQERMRSQTSGRWEEGSIRMIADKFGVSAESALRRLLDLGLAHQDEYDSFRREWQSRPIPVITDEEERSFGEYGHDVVLRTQGKNYVRMVLDAMHQEAIGITDAADYLDMKLKHLAALEDGVVTG